MADKFLNTICDNLENAVSIEPVVQINKEFFDDTFLPYLTGEKDHLNIFTKIAEISEDGMASIELMDKDGVVVEKLPPIINNRIDLGENFDDVITKIQISENLLAGSTGKALEKVFNVNDNKHDVWNDYISKHKRNTLIPVINDIESNNYDDDDDLEIIYT